MIERLAIPDVWVHTPRRIEDNRGWFAETFNEHVLSSALGDVRFVQDNQVFSRNPSTLRALHFQAPPRAQDKLVRVLRGAILDVAVDIRHNSVSFGKWVAARLSAENGVQIFVPKGFAHGYVTLEPNTEVFYKVSDYYSKDHERGMLWNDPAVGIEWGSDPSSFIVAERDRNWPALAALEKVF